MNFEYMLPPTAFKKDEQGNVLTTKTILIADEPYSILTGILDGDWTKETDKNKVIKAVLEYNFKLMFEKRAISEAVLLVDDLKKQTENFKKEQQETKDNFTRLLEEIKAENKRQLDLTVADLTNLIMGVMTGIATEEEEVEGSEDVTTE